MANEYHVTLVGLESLEGVGPGARVAGVGLEVQQTDDNATAVRVSGVALEVQQVDDTATDIRVSSVGLEVLCSVGAADMQEAALTFLGEAAVVIAGDRDASTRLAFGGAAILGLSGENLLRFRCAAPAGRVWTRIVPAQMEWACAAVAPPEPCHDEDLAAGGYDILAYLDGERFADGAGDHLRFIG